MAHSAIKPGSSCSKIKVVTIQSGYKYTCIKSGKKLVWSKGVKVSGSTVPSPVSTKPLSLEDLDVNQVYLKSRAEVAKYVSLGETSGTKINYEIGSNVESWRVDIAKNEINSTTKLWSQYFRPTNATIIWYSSKDIEWAKDKYISSGGNILWAVGFNSCTERYCGNASASSIGEKLIIEQGLAFQDQGLWNRSSAAHEFTHLAQYKLISPSNVNSVLWWTIEGGAQFYGEAIGFSPFDSKKSTRSGLHSQYARDADPYIASLFSGGSLKSLLKSNSPEISKRLMRSIESYTQSQGAVGLNYLLGSYATEVLVSIYGHEKMVNFYKLFSTNSDSESNFKNSFGISLDEFYVKLAPYFAKMADELNY